MTDDPTSSNPDPTPAQPAGPAGGSGDSLDPKIAAMLSYLLFGWIGGLVMYFTQKHPEVRFHAAQSIIVFGGLTVVSVVLSVLSTALLFAAGGAGFLIGLLNSLIGLGGLVLWIFLSIKGYNLEHFKLPVVGDMAERWAAQQA